MATPISNTQATIFTNIPKRVQRSWMSIPVAANNGTPVSATSVRHENALIQKINLEVEFSSLLGDADDILNSETDSQFDRITAWQETRRDWHALETAISTVVDTFIQRSRERSKALNVQTFDALRKVETTFTNPSAPPATNEPDLSTFVRTMNQSRPYTTRAVYEDAETFVGGMNYRPRPQPTESIIAPSESASRFETPSQLTRFALPNDPAEDDRLRRMEYMMGNMFATIEQQGRGQARTKTREHRRSSSRSGSMLLLSRPKR